MITTSDIADILYLKCRDMGLDVYREGNIPAGLIADVRAVVHARPLNEGKIWSRGFAEVNVHVPDNDLGNADLTTLALIERRLRRELHGCSEYDGTAYAYRVSQTTLLARADFRTHYINAKVLFRALNTIEDY